MVRERVVYKGKEYDATHGGAFDRGSADSYYGRGKDPHYYPQGTYKGDRIEQLTAEQVEAYYAGYDYNEAHGDKKDWG